MRQLELLAPARNLQIGIAAIDCGADAVYIAGPRFGARQAAGNDIEDIRQLCSYAHKFGVRIFVTLNTILYDNELEEAWKQMLAVQDAGADAVIVQDLAVVALAKDRGFGLPLHASTQCAIQTPEQAASSLLLRLFTRRLETRLRQSSTILRSLMILSMVQLLSSSSLLLNN